MKSFARAGWFVSVIGLSLGITSAAHADEPTVVIVPAPQGAQVLRAPTALVHIDSPEDAVLEERIEKRTYRAVCNAPCDKELSLEATYRIQGPSIKNSPEFRLAGNPGERIVLTVKPSARSSFTAGLVTTSVGGGVAIIGLAYGMVAGLGNITWCDGECSAETRARRSARADEIERNMGIMVGAGLVGVAIGLPLMLSNRRSDVEQRDEATTPRNETRPSPEAYVRVPPASAQREVPPPQGAAFVVPMAFRF